MLIEKYKFSTSDAQDLSEFLRPLLNFSPEKRPTAAQTLQNDWLQNSTRDKDANLKK